MKSRILRGRLLPLLFFLLIPYTLYLIPAALPAAEAATVTLDWDPIPEKAAGYIVHYGTTSRNYQYHVDVRDNCSCTISGLEEGKTYYFAASAYDDNSQESSISDELAYTIIDSESDSSGIPDSNTDPDQSDSGDNSSASEQEPPAAGTLPVEDFKKWIEAEDGVLNYPVEYAWDDSASAEGFIWVSNGAGISWDPAEDSGYAEYTVEVPAEGDYAIWGRVLTKSPGDNSFFIALNDGAFSPWHITVSKSWIWVPIGKGDGSQKGVYHLEAGEHTLTIKQREDGTQMDKILISGDTEYVPDGHGGSTDVTPKEPVEPQEDTGEEPAELPQNVDPAEVELWIEAEQANLTHPFESAADSKASSGQYVWVPYGKGSSFDAESDAGTIEFAFDIPAAGEYAVWGRIKAKSAGHNSFFVALDDGAFASWHIPESTSWKWRPIGYDNGIVYLEAGEHTLTIKQREAGTKIDRILITGDTKYTPTR